MRTVILGIIAVLLFALPVWAEEAPPGTMAVEELTVLKIENLGLRAEALAARIQTAQQELRRLQQEQELLAKTTAEKLGLKWDEYDLDLGKRQFVRKAKKEGPQ